MEPDDANLGKLTEESMKRKERLRKLREQAQKADNRNANDDDTKLPK